MVLLIRSQHGAARSAQPWENLPGELVKAVGYRHHSAVEIADQLEKKHGWKLVSVVPVTNSKLHDQELWFHKD